MNNFSINKAFKDSAKWSLLSVVIRQFFQVAITILLARQLSPEEFAVAGITLSIIGFFSIIAQVGLAQAIIIKKELDKIFIDTINSVLIMTGIIGYIFLLILTPYFNKYYSQIDIGNIIVIVGISIMIGSWGCVPTAILQKNLDFKGLTFINITTALIQLIFTCYLLFEHLGIWAIVLPQLIGTVVTVVLSYYRTGYRPCFTIDISNLRESLPYGYSSLISQVINYLSANSIVLLMGRFWSPMTTGQYIFVESKTLKPYELIVLTLFSNLYPILSRISYDVSQMAIVFTKLGRIAINVIVPTYATLIVLIPELVPLLFGSKWRSTVTLFQILMIVGILRSVGFGANSVFLSLQMPRLVWYVSLIRLSGYLAVIAVAINYDLTVISISLGVVAVEGVTGIFNLFLANKALKIKTAVYIREIRLDYFILFLFIVGLLMLSHLMELYVEIGFLKIIGITLVSISYYLLLLRIFDRFSLFSKYLKLKI